MHSVAKAYENITHKERHKGSLAFWVVFLNIQEDSLTKGYSSCTQVV